MEFRERVTDALALVLPDLAASATRLSGFAVTRIEGRVYIERDGDLNGSDVIRQGFDSVQLVVSVADAVQGLVSHDAGDEVWPVCPEHGFGLHPEVVNFSAVWVCRAPRHIVALIGHLRD